MSARYFFLRCKKSWKCLRYCFGSLRSERSSFRAAVFSLNSIFLSYDCTVSFKFSMTLDSSSSESSSELSRSISGMISFSRSSSYIRLDLSTNPALYLSTDFFHTKVYLFAFASSFVPSMKMASSSICFSSTSLQRNCTKHWRNSSFTSG